MKLVDCQKHGAQPSKPFKLGDGSFGICCGVCLEMGQIEEAWIFPKAPLNHVRLNSTGKVDRAA